MRNNTLYDDPFMEQMGWDYEDLFLAIYVELDYLHSELLKFHNSLNVNDIYSYFLLMVKKMLDVWESIHLILDNKIDLTSLFSLSRVIADNYVVMRRIHIDAKDKDERNFRHYLYLLDGVKSRIRQLETKAMPHNPNIMSSDDYEKIVSKNASTLCREKKNEQTILDMIRKSPLYDKSLEGSIVKGSNWKYKELKDTSTKTNCYTWEDLYGIYFKSPILSRFFSSYLSHFVHGLGISNISFEGDYESNRQLILCINIEFMSFVKDAVGRFYMADIDRHNIDFKKTPMVMCLLQSMDKDYIEQNINMAKASLATVKL